MLKYYDSNKIKIIVVLVDKLTMVNTHTVTM